MSSIIYSILVIVSMTFAVRASNNMLATTIPLLVKYNLNFNGVMIGLISAIFSVSTFFMSGFINSSLKSKDRRILFITSSIIYAILFPFFAIANFISVWILSIAVGFVLGALMPNIITSASLYPDQRVRERVVSIYTLALSLSLIVGPTIESAILTKISLRQTFVFFGIFGILTAILSFFIKFPQEEVKTTTVRASHIFKNVGFRMSVINNLMYNVPFAMITVFGGIYAKEMFHVNYAIVTLMFSLFFSTSFVSRLFLTIKPPQNIPLQMLVSTLLTGLGLIILLISNNIFIYSISFLILGIPHGLTYPLSLLTLTRTFPPELRNRANSYFFSILTAIGTLIPIIFGVTIEFFGMKMTFVFITIFVFTLLIFLKRISKGFEQR
ncbi:MFS transporter [Athalassotoga saccharophila]|uniref:MFS transporter n=1 Tax=Athalassotoga saccharophila TaxID=1441386 RepID=UPI0013797392|nr:MFS transporter [Athalassotoga saccharophila]BBJ27155.1 hypothetical protein ATHSA_0022 [Athalassotoga saccharophila]